MKLTKFVHSCVLVEHEGKTILFDPGIFSWNSGLVTVEKLPKIDTVVVSHKHADHCAEPFVRALVQAFPDAEWFAPLDIHEELQSWGVTTVSDKSNDTIETVIGAHAPVSPFAEQVYNLVTHWRNVVTHPGDTHDFAASKDVLLLPIQAPWGTTIRAVELANELKPKYILPIHDWMWREEWKNTTYDRLEQLFANGPTTFLRPTDGQPIEVTL